MNKMIKIGSTIIVIAVFVLLTSCVDNAPSLSSPDGRYHISVSVDDETKVVTYSVSFNGDEIVSPSSLGMLLEDGRVLGKGLYISRVENRSVQQSWKPIYGERSEYPEVYNESLVRFASTDSKKEELAIRFRAYNEGFAFRYEFVGDAVVHIKDELTEFSLCPDAMVWASTLSQGIISRKAISDLSQPSERPLLVQLPDSLYLAIGEAAQIDFSRMKLTPAEESGNLVVSLDGEVVDEAPFHSPWRFVMAGESAGAILEHNYLVLNLNDPNQIIDHSWIKPGKVIRDLTLTTEGAKAYIDFAVSHGIQYVIESAGWYGDEFTKEADASTVTVDPKRSTGPLDMKEVIRYGEENGIDIMVYVNRNQLEKQLDQILPLYAEWGIKGIKFGFVRTGDQKWTSWMHEAVRKAADYKMVLSIHDDYRPVGYSRTYPNLMTQEGIRGDEESPTNEQTLMTMFTRMIAGAGDNTICYFAPRVDEMGSHASQLAKSVCLYSPLLWLYWYDRPQAAGLKSGGAGGAKSVIEEVPELEFFDVLPTVWDDTKVIHSEVGVLGTIARKNGENWFVGCLNGQIDRIVSIPLSFLDEGIEYEATIYYDDETVNSISRVGIEKLKVDDKTVISRELLKNNGVAMRIFPK